MNRESIILIGAGGHAHACIDVIEQHGKYQIAGLVGMAKELHECHFGYSVIATDDDLPGLVNEYPCALVTVGQIRSPEIRIRIYQKATKLGFHMPVIVAPSAYISRHASIGAGSIVMHGAIVNAGTLVGENCIINTHALVEHDAIVENSCHVSTGAILNGNVSIGAGSFIGSNASVKEGVTIGKGCVIGMGLSVRHNQKDFSQFVG